MEEIIAVGIGIALFIFAIDRDGKKKFRSCKGIGDIGESIVANKLRRLNDKFEVVNDVHIGGCQIDHLVICRECGIIFVIETKMWGGVIRGRVNNNMWQQDKGGVINYFNNPIKQNKYHCLVVENYYAGYEIINIVVFVRNKNVPQYQCVISDDKIEKFITETVDKFIIKKRKQ